MLARRASGVAGLAACAAVHEPGCVTNRSGSMKPAFQRGDILFLNNQQDDPIRVGEIVVFKVRGRDIPIVHRVLNVHER